MPATARHVNMQMAGDSGRSRNNSLGNQGIIVGSDNPGGPANGPEQRQRAGHSIIVFRGAKSADGRRVQFVELLQRAERAGRPAFRARRAASYA